MKKAQIPFMLERLIAEVEDADPGEKTATLRSALATAFRCGVRSAGLRYTSDADIAEACGLPRASDLSVAE